MEINLNKLCKLGGHMTFATIFNMILKGTQSLAIFVSNSKFEHQNLPLRNAQNHSVVHFPTATVKPVYKDRPKDQQNVVTLDRWSL